MDKELVDRINELRVHFNGLVDFELKNRILAGLEIIKNIPDDEAKEWFIKRIEDYRRDCDI